MDQTKQDEKDATNRAMLQMYEEGQTLQQIADQYGLTRERIRQRIAEVATPETREKNRRMRKLHRDGKLMLVGQWLQDQGVMTWEQFAARTGLTLDEYRRGVAAGDIPSNHVRFAKLPPRSKYTHDQAVEGIRNAHRNAGSPQHFTSEDYEIWKDFDAPSKVLICMKWGWAATAEAAGVPTKSRPRRKIPLADRVDEALQSVHHYVQHCLANNQNTTMDGYHKWAKEDPERFPGASLRPLMAKHGLTWNGMVLQGNQTNTEAAGATDMPQETRTGSAHAQVEL